VVELFTSLAIALATPHIIYAMLMTRESLSPHDINESRYWV